MRWLAILGPLALLSCTAEDAGKNRTSQPPLVERIENEWRTRLLDAARDPTSEIVLDDDTPRLNTPDDPDADSPLCYLRGASFHVPLQGLDRVTVGLDDRGLELVLAYGEAEAVVLDATGASATKAAFEALKAVGSRLGEETWKATEAAVRAWAAGHEPRFDDLDERIAAYARSRVRWDRRFDKRFSESQLALTRAALRSRVRDDGELSDVYRACRLVRVKQQIIESVGGPPALTTRPLAAGPVLGVARTGEDAFRALLTGPDSMVVQIQTRGKLRAKARDLLVGSFRPYARRGARAGRPGAEASSARAALLALTALHLDPTIERAVTLIAALKLQEQSLSQRRQLARALAAWMKVDEPRLLAAAAD